MDWTTNVQDTFQGSKGLYEVDYDYSLNISKVYLLITVY